MPRGGDAVEALTDDELLARCVAGDRTALGAVFDRYSRQVYAAALVVLESHSDAEDVLSETLILLWRKRSSIHLYAGSLLPWLVTTARNLARNARRKRSRRDHATLDEGVSTVASESADRSVETSELAAALGRELGQLSELDREIVVLCLLKGTSYEDAARRLGISHASVRNRLARARSRLREGLTTEGHDA